MQLVIYDVAVSIDGYIAGPDEDISRFAHDGPVVDDYLERLAGYRTAIMGRGTYEFGYRFGMEPGQNPYEHMDTHVFSSTLRLPSDSAVAVNQAASPEWIERLKETSDGPVYLCGGGAFAGWLLRHELIDRLRLKRAPIVLGDGVPLFGGEPAPAMRHIVTREYEDGYLFQEFAF